MSFENFKLSSQLLYNLEQLGYAQPTPVQAQAIPKILKKHDVIALAQTGTGKTAAYALPLLERCLGSKANDLLINSSKSATSGNQIKYLIVVPTRELAQQVQENFLEFSFGINCKIECVFGGTKINPQMMRLRGGCDFLIATPGRLLDLMERSAVKLDCLQSLVLDEADRMLDLGFAADIEKIIRATPSERQSLLFSATLSEEIESLAYSISKDPIRVQVDPNNSAAQTVEHWLHPVDKKLKIELLLELIGENNWQRAIVFVKTKKMAKQLHSIFVSKGIVANSLHGDKSQQERNKAIQQFKNSTISFLIATDVAARGLDIDDLPLVINFDLPKVAEDYIHRIGRTGRAGKSGRAVSLVAADEVDLLSHVESLIGQLIKRIDVRGFVPNHSLPATSLKPLKKKKPHKKKLAKAMVKDTDNKNNLVDTKSTGKDESQSLSVRSAPAFLSGKTKSKVKKR
ncbi:MAG: DEAD/DEAH box helicase [Gammaproteobacteria bacterium]|nr:DEAD/DEAH box helicase [Gammaproteobacteria bacterium]